MQHPYSYLRKKADAGELQLPKGAPNTTSFGNFKQIEDTAA